MARDLESRPALSATLLSLAGALTVVVSIYVYRKMIKTRIMLSLSYRWSITREDLIVRYLPVAAEAQPNNQVQPDNQVQPNNQVQPPIVQVV